MLKTASWLGGSLLLFMATVLPLAAGQDLAETVVSVVSFNEQGQAVRQGLGVVVGRDGRILTSAALLRSGQNAIVRLNSGALYVVRQVLKKDEFRDLILVKVEAEDLKAAPLTPAQAGSAPPKLLVAVRQEGQSRLTEVASAGSYPLSPRLRLVKIANADLTTEPGAPLFTLKGELAAMACALAGSPRGQGGGLLFLLNHDTQALIQEKTTKQENGKDPTPPSNSAEPGLADFWEGVAASLNQDWPVAEKKFGAALTAPVKLPEASFGRGVARYHLGNYLGAGVDFAAATEALPRYGLAFLWAGKTWERRGNREEARQAYLKAAAFNPDVGEAWYRLGIMAYEQGHLSQAQEYLEKAKDDFGQAARREWYLGNIHRAQGRPKEALAAYQRARELDPKFWPAYLESGKVLLNLGRPKEAVEVLNDLVTLQPRRPEARYQLALAHLVTWDQGQAWKHYFVLRDLDPEMAASLEPILGRSP